VAIGEMRIALADKSVEASESGSSRGISAEGFLIPERISPRFRDKADTTDVESKRGRAGGG